MKSTMSNAKTKYPSYKLQRITQRFLTKTFFCSDKTTGYKSMIARGVNYLFTKRKRLENP